MTTRTMTTASIASIESALRSGKADLALAEAKSLCQQQGASRELGIEIAKVAASVYRDLIADPVHDLAKAAPTELPAEVGPLVGKALQRLITFTEDWEKKLWQIHTERLARELRDWTRMRQLEPAAANVARLIALVGPEQRAKRAAYIGNVLATIINNQKEAQQLLALMAKKAGEYYLTPDLVQTMEQARAKRSSEAGSFNLENLEREFSSTLTQVAAELKGFLPDPTKVNEPDEAALRDTGDHFKSILRVPIWRQQADLFLDATQLLVEFVPREQSSTAKLARVEGRTYAGLGITAKKCVQTVLMDVGKNKFFCAVYREWAKEYAGTDSLRPIVEFMGALKTQEFNEFLKSVKSDKAVGDVVAQQVDKALGSVAGAEAAEELMNSLRVLLSRKRIEASDLAEAEKLIASLGSVVKTPRTTDEERARILEFARTHIPEDLTRLAYFTALQLFTTKVDVQTSPQIHFALKALARGLWMQDQTTAMHKGGERQSSELGFREEIVQGLIKVAPRDPHFLARTVEPLSSRYSGAFIAIAEVFEKVPSAEYLMVLERMLNQTLTHDESRASIYQQEFYWDAATQQRKPYTREKILAPLIYSIGTIGGEAGKAILKRYQAHIQSGKVPAPTPEIATFMAKFLGDEAFGAVSAIAEAAEIPVDPAHVKPLLADLSAWYLMTSAGKRRMKKISALTQLARLLPVDAVDPVFAQFSDKDPLVASAAITCLNEFALPTSPKTIRNLTIDRCLEALEHKDPAVRTGALKLLKEMGPMRKDVKDKALVAVKGLSRPEIRDAVASMLKGATAAPQKGNTATGSATGGGDSNEKTAPPNHTDKLALKAQHLAARKAWIAGGKKGDPPAPPPGMD
jgi:hypothetical protein